MNGAGSNSVSSTRNWKLIKASPGTLYRVFTNPDDLAVWLAPGKMTGRVHHFDYNAPNVAIIQL